jgi:hypothetical protein
LSSAVKISSGLLFSIKEFSMEGINETAKPSGTGCCDNSPSQHASHHHAEIGHPIITSFEPGEDLMSATELEKRASFAAAFTRPQQRSIRRDSTDTLDKRGILQNKDRL